MKKTSGIIRYLFGLLLFVSLVLMVNDYNRIESRFNVINGHTLASFDDINSTEEKAAKLTVKLKEIELDSNYFYSFSQSKVFDKTAPPIFYNCSYAELSNFKNQLATSKGSELMLTFEQSAPDIKSKLPVIDHFSRQKIQKINIEGVGNISFCLEDTMILNGSYRALLIISKGVEESFIESLKILAFPEGVPNTTVDTFTLSKKIYASLTPTLSDQFSIIRADLDTVKNIDLQSKDYITWEWIVTPLKPGESRLVLKLSRVEAPRGAVDKFYPSKIIPVHVAAIERSWLGAASDFFSKEWKWILTSIAALIGWWLALRKERKKSPSTY